MGRMRYDRGTSTRAAMDADDVEVYEARAKVGFPPCWRRRCETPQTARDPAAF